MEARTNKRIIVTGATGLIGAALIQRLSERGDHVIAFVRDPVADARRVPEAAEYTAWSASMVEGEWKERINDADAIINLAGAPIAKRWTKEWKRVIYDSRILGTRHLVEGIAAAQNKPEVLVHGSAVGYYGASAHDLVTEDSPSGNDFLGRLCADWEAEAWRAMDYGVRVATLRTGVVLDPEGGALKQLLLPFKFFVGGPIGSGHQPWPWIHKEDELNIILHALDNQSVSGPLNAVAPVPITNREFSRVLGKVLKRPSFFAVPGFVMHLMFGEGAVALTDGQKAEPKRTLESGYQFIWSDAEAALRDLIE